MVLAESYAQLNGLRFVLPGEPYVKISDQLTPVCRNALLRKHMILGNQALKFSIKCNNLVITFSHV